MPTILVCPYFFCCPYIKDPQHTSTYLHLCKEGISCPRVKDPSHTKDFYHIQHTKCDQKHTAWNFDMNHFISFHHKGIPDFMEPCKYGSKCPHLKDFDHITHYQHEPTPLYPTIPFVIPPPSVLPPNLRLERSSQCPALLPQKGFGFLPAPGSQQKQDLEKQLAAVRKRAAEDKLKREAPKAVCPKPCCPECNKEEHVWKYRHQCPYGRSCKYTGEQVHAALFFHAEIPVCPSGRDCGALTDPKHRAENHHPGYWDFLIPCPQGKKCQDVDNKEHCSKYQHAVPPVFAPPPK